jgi:hypothetical protein
MRHLAFAVVLLLLLAVTASSSTPTTSSSSLLVEAAVARVCPPGVPTAFVRAHTTHECSTLDGGGERRGGAERMEMACVRVAFAETDVISTLLWMRLV